MAKIPFDTTFERAGRPLRSWLVDLVADDFATRLTAGEWLQAMQSALPSVHTNGNDLDWDNQPDSELHREHFKAAVRSVVRSPGFDAPVFVRRLIARMIENKRSWLEFVAIKPNRPWTDHEGMSFAGFSASRVFASLDIDLLADCVGLREMFADRQLCSNACEALARIGPPALDFAPDLMAWLDEVDRYYGQKWEVVALGSIGRDDPGVIDGLLRRLRSTRSAVRAGAAGALQAAGPPLAGRLEVAIDLLFGATKDPDILYATLPALAALGRDRAAVLDHILGFARPQPPRVQVTRYGDFEHREDETMRDRGPAISALPFFTGFADRVVPVLVDALDSFEEFDPDWGERGRVCAALEEFGPNAEPAVPCMISFLDAWLATRSDGDEWPKDVFRVLRAIGPAAIAALPVLRAIRADTYDADDPRIHELDPDDPLDRAILAIASAGAGEAESG